MGFTREFIQGAYINSAGQVFYNIAFPCGVQSRVYVCEEKNGTLKAEIYEGNKHNTLEYKANGDMYIDGNKCYMEITFFQKSEATIDEMSNVSPRMRNVEHSLSPWGSQSSYNQYLSSYEGNRCSWGVDFARLTVSVACSVLSTALGNGMGYILGTALFSALVSSMIQEYTIYGAKAGFSWKMDVYEREDSMSIDRYYMNTGTVYTDYDFSGTSFPHTFYTHNWFS